MTPAELEKAVRERYNRITKTLIEKKLTITTMESCTSGQVASLLTDTEGASAALRGAYVTYSNFAKIKAGVPEETIERFSVYSAETAAAMAKACREAMEADLGVGVTGSLGNVDPANAAASVPGQVWFSLNVRGEDRGFYVELAPETSRFVYKLRVANEIAKELEKVLAEF